MKLKANLMLAASTLLLVSCGGSSSGQSGSSPAQNMTSYDGNDYYAEVTGESDTFVLSGLPVNSENQVVWNSIALIYNTGSGTWSVAMNSPNYYPNVGHQVTMGPFSGVWTTTPARVYQYRVTQSEWKTGLTGNANPINSDVPYDIFQPAFSTDWSAMPANSNVNLCSVSTNSVYTAELGGGEIACSIEVMDVETSEVTASRIHLKLVR